MIRPRDKETGLQLKFITHIGHPANNEDDKRQVRQHVSQCVALSRHKGKDRRRRVLPQLKVSLEIPEGLLASNQITDQMTISTIHKRDIQVPEDPAIERFGSCSDPFVRYPIETTTEERRLVDEIFHKSKMDFQAFRNAWFPIALASPAAFHQFLSNSTILLQRHPTFARFRPRQSAVYHSRALALINQNMRDAAAGGEVSDGILAAVISLACYSYLSGDEPSYWIHMNGLEKFLQLRGGYCSLNLNKLLSLAICWVDISGSFRKDRKPQFPLPVAFLPTLPPLPPDTKQARLYARLSVTWTKSFPERFEILEIINDLLRFNHFIQQDCAPATGGPPRKVYQDHILSGQYSNPLQYRMPAIQSSSPSTTITLSPGALLQEACRLAGIMYVSSTRVMSGITPSWPTQFLDKLQTLLSSHPTFNWMEFGLLEIWVKTFGFIESPPGPLRDFFQAELSKAMKRQEINARYLLLRKLKTFLWVEGLHNTKLSILMAELG